MPPVFVDTSIWYAAANTDDADHHAAQSLLGEHDDSLVTSDLVLAELWNLSASRINHLAATRLVASLADGATRVECAVGADLATAHAAGEAFSDQAFSFTDRVSWAIMERLAIVDALALDSDFRVYRYGPGRRKAFVVRP